MDHENLVFQTWISLQPIVEDNTHPETPPVHTFEEDFDQDVRAKDQFHPPEHLIEFHW